MRTSFVVLLAMTVTHCHYGDLSVHGKQCDPQIHPCPDGYLCVENPVSPTDSSSRCFRPQDASPCPAERFCKHEPVSGDMWIESCVDGYSSVIEEGDACSSLGLTCHPDTILCARACQDGCGPAELCDLGLGLCRPEPSCSQSACLGGRCIEGLVCVPTPREEAEVASPSEADLACFSLPPPTPPAPGTCILTGRVYMFWLKRAEATIGLTVRLHHAGAMDSYKETTVFADPEDESKGHYRFTDVPTSQAYDIEILSGSSNSGVQVATTLYTNLAVRTDVSESIYANGVFAHSLQAMQATDLAVFTSTLFPDLDPGRDLGLVFGRVTDCNDLPLGNVTVSLAVAPAHPAQVYYFDEGNILLPNPDLESTTLKGFYAAAGVPVTENHVGFSARVGPTPQHPGLVPFVMLPGAVVIADLQLPGHQLP